MRATKVSLFIVILAATAACSRATPIPPGAQVVTVRIDGTSVVLNPDVAKAGDLYLAVESPPGSSLSFVEHKPTAAAQAGPLSDADLIRLADGDTEALSVTGFDPGGCSETQDAEDRGMIGPCGNVMHVVVLPGKYAILTGTPDADAESGTTAPLAVLVVMP